MPTRINDETMHIARAKSKQHLLDNYSRLFRQDFFETGIKVYLEIFTGKPKGQIPKRLANIEEHQM